MSEISLKPSGSSSLLAGADDNNIYSLIKLLIKL